jgi:hypothetical protein
MSRRGGHEFRVRSRHPIAVWLILGTVFLGSAGINLFLAVIGTEVWPYVVGVALVAVAVCCVVMAWRERDC